MYVCDEANFILEQEVKAVQNPTEGQMIVSDPCIMHTCGWYVGMVCAEYIDSIGWLYQPYDRLTDYYTTREQAEAALADFETLGE